MSLTSMVSSSRLSLPSTVLSTTYTVDLYIGKHVEKKKWKTCHVNHHNHIIPHPRWKIQQKWYILMSANSLVFSCLLSSQSTVLTTIDLHVLNVVIHVSRINKNLSCRTLSQQHITSYVVEKFQLKWYLLMSATSLIFSSMLSLPSTVLSTTNSHVLNIVRHVTS